MGLFDFLKPKTSDVSLDRTLKKDDFTDAGVCYYESNIKKLATVRSDWKKSCKTLIKEDKAGKKIFKNDYINKPVKLIPDPTNKHDKNAVQVVIAGELVGYIPSEQTKHVKDILSKREIKYISAFISGGEYKVISLNEDIFKDSYSTKVKITIAYI